MNLRLITAPDVLPLSLAELKAEARLDTTDATEDARLAGCLRAAVNQLDGAEGLLGRSLITQTWQLLLPGFPQPGYRRIDLPLPPLQAVDSVTYLHQAGDEQALATDRYQVVGIGSTQPGWVAAAYGVTWPTTRCQDDAVRITFRCGYGDSWNDVPEALRQGIAALAASLFDGCGHEAAIASVLDVYRVRAV